MIVSSPGEAPGLDGIEVERGARRLQMAADVRALHVELVRLDLDPLHEAGVQAADQDREHEPGAGRQTQQPQRPEERVRQEQPGRDERDDGEDHVRGVLGVHVGVERRLDVAVPPAGRVRELRDVELIAAGNDDQEQRADDRQVRAHRRGEVELPAQCAGGVGPDGQQPDDDERGRSPAQQEAPERQIEDVEADVAAEGRVIDPPCRAVDEEEDDLPRAAPRGPRAERQQHGDHCQADPDEARRIRQLDPSELTHGRLRRDAPGQPDAHHDRHQHRREADAEQRDLGPEAGEQDVAPTERVVPHDVGDQAHDPAQQAQEHEQRDDRSADHDPSAPRKVGGNRWCTRPIAAAAVRAARAALAPLLVERRDVALGTGLALVGTPLAARVGLFLAALQLLEELVEPR